MGKIASVEIRTTSANEIGLRNETAVASMETTLAVDLRNNNTTRARKDQLLQAIGTVARGEKDSCDST